MNNPVFEEIRARVSGKRNSKIKLALSIEGGGMRGVISGAMVAALEDLDVPPNTFDCIFGSSAGSIAGAFYIARQARKGTSIYFEDITGPEFFSPWRFILPGAPVQIEYLVKDVLDQIKPLDYERVIKSGLLRPIATDAQDGARHIFEPAKTRTELEDQFLASARIPLLAGAPYEISSRLFLDASLSEAIPWIAPIDLGYTHVLVLGTRPLGVGKSVSVTARAVARTMSLFVPEGSRELLRDRPRTSRARASELRDAVLAGTFREAFVSAITPAAGSELPGQVEQSPEKLIAAATLGYNAVEDAFGVERTVEFNTDGYFGKQGSASHES